MFKRTLCALLALLCITGTLPVAAFAAEEELTLPVETEAVVEELPVETEAVAEELPVETEAVVEELPVETEAVVEELPVETEAVVEELPVETEAVAEELPVETEAVVEELPVETEAVVEELPAETEAPAEKALVMEEVSGSLNAYDVYYQDSEYYQYFWCDYLMEESESNNSRSKADVLPVGRYDHTAINGYVNSRSDSKDYYKITVTETMYLKLLCVDGISFKHTQYRLYDSDGDLLKTAAKKSTWEDGGEKDTIFYLTYVLNPGTYYIRVYEPGKSGYSSVSTTYTLVVHLYPRLAKPVVSTTNNSTSGKPVVSWNSVSGAEYYTVYRATSKNGTYYEKANVWGTTWTDTAAKAGKTYYYKVQAFSSNSTYDESNNQSSKSSYKSRTCDCAAPVITVTAKASTGKNYVDWEKVSGADEYKVYYSKDYGETWKLLKTTTSSAYTHKSGVAGKTYYYKVKAVVSGKSAANSAYSNIAGRTSR